MATHVLTVNVNLTYQVMSKLLSGLSFILIVCVVVCVLIHLIESIIKLSLLVLIRYNRQQSSLKKLVRLLRQAVNVLIVVTGKWLPVLLIDIVAGKTINLY